MWAFQAHRIFPEPLKLASVSLPATLIKQQTIGSIG